MKIIFLIYLILVHAANAECPKSGILPEKNVNDIHAAITPRKCDFSPEADWQKNKEKIIDFVKTFDGAITCPKFFGEGALKQLYQDAKQTTDLVTGATTAYFKSDIVQKAVAIRAAAVALAEGFTRLPADFEKFVSDIKEMPPQIYNDVSRWMKPANDCSEVFATQKGLRMSAGALAAGLLGRSIKGDRAKNFVERRFDDKEIITNPVESGIAKGNYQGVKIADYRREDLTISSSLAYASGSEFYRDSKNVLMLGENPITAPRINEIARFNPQTKIVAGGIEPLGKSQQKNLDLRYLDNTSGFPLAWENRFDRVLVNHGLCVCCGGSKTCGGIESSITETTNFLRRVSHVLDKKNPTSKAVLTANPMEMNRSGKDELKTWVEAAANAMKEYPVQIKIFQRNGRLLQLEIVPN